MTEMATAAAAAATLFGGIVYINLDRRTDRRTDLERSVLGPLGLLEVAERFPAIPRRPGIVGCGLSHLAVLRMARDRGWKNVLIWEDDFELLVTPTEFWREVRAVLEGPVAASGGMDVLMLSYNLQRSEPHSDRLLRVLEAQTASGYIVWDTMYDKLIELYEWAMPQLETTGRHWEFANDQIWKHLQGGSRWFAMKRRLGKQRAGYSDNGESWADLGV